MQAGDVPQRLHQAGGSDGIANAFFKAFMLDTRLLEPMRAFRQLHSDNGIEHADLSQQKVRVAAERCSVHKHNIEVMRAYRTHHGSG